MIALRVREEVGVARAGELARGGVPLPAGVLHDPSAVRVLTPDGRETPAQARAMERWADGSVRWLALWFLADVPRQGEAVYGLQLEPPETPAAVRASVGEVDDGVRVDTGAVSFLVRRNPFDPLAGFPGVEGVALATAGDRRAGAASDDVDVTLDVLDPGPVVVRVRARGRHGAGPLDFELELEAVAGRAEVVLDYRFVNREDAREVALEEWNATLRMPAAAFARCGAFDAIHRSAAPFVLADRGAGHRHGIFAVAELEPRDGDWIDESDAAYWERWEWNELGGRRAAGWIDVATDPDGAGVTVALADAALTAPTRLAYDGAGVQVGLWPRDAGPLPLTQGVAGTRRFGLRAHDAGDRELSRFVARLDAPLVAEPGPWVWETGVLPEVLLPSERHAALEAHMRDELFSWALGGQSIGFMDRGDCAQVPAGPRAGFTANNEYDALYALCLHYLRSGERAYLESARAYADHLVDVDVIHHSTRNPFEAGGVRAHGVRHVHYVTARTADGPVETSIDTAHMWVEGLLLYAAIAGSERHRDAAVGIGDCLLRLVDLGWARPEPGPRNGGWPLMALSGLHRSTGEPRFLDGARRVAADAMAVQRPDGRWTMRLGFHDGYCPWQNAVLLTGLSRLLAVAPDPEVERAFRAGADALLEHGRHPDGSFVYLDRYDYRWATVQCMLREALWAAYELTGEERFLVAGLHGGGEWYRRPGGRAATSDDIAAWRAHLPFLGAAERAGLLVDADPAPSGALLAG